VLWVVVHARRLCKHQKKHRRPPQPQDDEAEDESEQEQDEQEEIHKNRAATWQICL